MKIEKINQEKSDTLFIFLAGWSVSPAYLKSLPLPIAADYWFVYDYRDLRFEETFSNYQHIHLIAWSLGVWVASYLWSDKSIFESTTAINGTPFPVDDKRGIPTAIFEGTLQNIHEDGMRRFNRRMCGNKASFLKYVELPKRSIEEVKEELTFLYRMIQVNTDKYAEETIFNFWDRAIIATEDLIFPTTNQRNCWQGHCPITEIQAPHLPFNHEETLDELWKRSLKNS